MEKKLSVRSHVDVYPPGEDSWYFAEFLSNFLSRLKAEKKRRRIICEIGVGTGYILIYLSLKFSYYQYFGTDISPIAVSLSMKNIQEWIPANEYYICCTQYLNCFNPQQFSPDIIYFNPPYVRTSQEEYERRYPPIVRSWAGGPGGISTILDFLSDLTRYQFKYAFFLSSSLNENSKLKNHTELDIIEIERKKIEGEQLIIYQATSKS